MLSVFTKGFPVGASPTILLVQLAIGFKNMLPFAATAVDCCPYILVMLAGFEIKDCSL